MRLLPEAQGQMQRWRTLLALQQSFDKMRLPTGAEEEGAKGITKCQSAACITKDR
jgi:hypothetical protein